MYKIILFLAFQLSILSCFSQTPTEREMEMIDEINLVRTDPIAYIKYINEYLDYWEEPDSVRAIADTLINYLKGMEPIGKLDYDKKMFKDGTAHGRWMLRNDAFEHSNLDYGENLVAGDETPRFAVVSLLIDDGVPDRGHRWNILEPEYTKVACIEVLGEIEGLTFVYIQEFD